MELLNLRNMEIYSKKELRTYIKLPAREVQKFTKVVKTKSIYNHPIR